MKELVLLFCFAIIFLSACVRGPRGDQGSQGAQGFVGEQGESGPQGNQGSTGLPGQDAVIDIIDPCGDAVGIYDEVILRLSTGQLLASFSDSASGSNTRFSLLERGFYVTTDGSNCHFSVDQDYNVIF